jgi:hypothetical protein
VALTVELAILMIANVTHFKLNVETKTFIQNSYIQLSSPYRLLEQKIETKLLNAVFALCIKDILLQNYRRPIFSIRCLQRKQLKYIKEPKNILDRLCELTFCTPFFL